MKINCEGWFFQKQTVTTAWCCFRFWIEWSLFQFSSWKKYFFSCHQEALESWNNDHSTQNRKLHQAIVTVCFRKNHPSQFVFILPLEVCQKKKFGTYKENLRNSPFFSAEHIFACTQRRLGAKLSSLLSTRGWVWPWRASKRKTQILSPIWDHCELLTVFFN